MGKQIIMDVTFNLMGRLNLPYLEEVFQKISIGSRVKSLVKEGQSTISYVEIEEGEVDFTMFKTDSET